MENKKLEINIKTDLKNQKLSQDKVVFCDGHFDVSAEWKTCFEIVFLT